MNIPNIPVIISYIYRNSASQVFARDMSSYERTEATWTDPVNALPTEQQLIDNETAALEWAAPAPSLTYQLAAAFNSLPLDVKATFSPLRVAVDDAIKRGDITVAKRIIELQEVPQELEATKTALLAFFD